MMGRSEKRPGNEREDIAKDEIDSAIGSHFMKRVLVTEPMHDDGMSLLYDRDDVEVVVAPDVQPDTLAALMPGVHGIAVRVAKFPAELLALAPDLEVISRHGVGCDNLDVAHLSERGVPVAIANGANSSSVAEHTMAMALTMARRLPAVDAAVRTDNWQARSQLLAHDLEDAVMLVVGFGRIGRKVAPRAKAFGMEVIVADIALDRALADSVGCEGIVDFREALPKTDIVTFHIPLDDMNRNIMSTGEFEMMKPGGMLINCARGGIVDEAAMLAALESGHLRAAGLDVFSDEPLSFDDPVLAALTKRDDVILAPHTGAASHGAMRAMAVMAAQNILDCFDGVLVPENVFNPGVLEAA